MNTKKFVLAAIAGFIVMFGISALWHKIVMGSFYGNHYEAIATNVDLLYVLIGYLVIGLLMAFIYPIGYKGGSPLKEGPRFGALIGLVGLLPMTLIVLLGSGLVTHTGAIVDVIWHIIEEGIGGTVIALVYGRIKP